MHGDIGHATAACLILIEDSSALGAPVQQTGQLLLLLLLIPGKSTHSRQGAIVGRCQSLLFSLGGLLLLERHGTTAQCKKVVCDQVAGKSRAL